MSLSTWRARWCRGRPAMAVTLLVVAAVTLGACGSASKPATTASAVGSRLSRACTAVAAVLGNGPDPGVDPVGYAEAQPIQLRKVQTSDAKLHAAIDSLANAYQLYARGGSRAAKAAVKTAAARLDAICPGATS